MKVRATSAGFYAGARIREGSVFDFKGDKPAKWMAPVEAVETKPAKAPKAPKPAAAATEPAKAEELI